MKAMNEQVVDSQARFYPEATITKLPTLWQSATVRLEGTDYATVTLLRPGSYIIVISKVTDGPTATFTLTKSSDQETGHVMRITHSASDDTMLELSWSAQSPLRLRKTKPFHDGDYIVDFNLKSFASPASGN